MKTLQVGFFAFLTLSVFFILSLALTQKTSIFESYNEYYTELADAVGLIEKAPVKIAGLNVGRIEKMSLQGKKAKLILKIQKKIKLPQDSVVQIKNSGALGDKYLEIIPGDDIHFLSSKSFIATTNISGDLYGASEGLAMDLQDIVKHIKKQFIGQDGSTLKEITDSLRDILSQIKKTTKVFANITTQNENRLQVLVENLSKFGEKLSKLDLNALEDFSKNMALISKNLTEGKGTLGKLLTDDELINKTTETMESLRQLTQKFNTTRTEIDIYSTYNNDAGGYASFHLDIIPSPEKILRLGLSSSDFGPKTTERKETIKTTGSLTTNTYKTVHTEPIYRINAQVGRKFSDFALRIGLIESSGGIGLDYYFPKLGIKTSLDAFDWNRYKTKPTLRLSGEIRLWNVIYIKGVGEDLFHLKQKGISYGAGLRLNDNNVSSLLSFIK